MADNYEDDASVLPTHHLWRRIPPWHLVPDSNANGIRISSAAFDNDPDGSPMSVVLAEVVRESGREPGSTLQNLDGFGLASITVKLARDKGQKVVRQPEEDEPAHGLVVGDKPRSCRKAFADSSRWVVPPPGRAILAVDRLPLDWTVNLTEQEAHRLLINRPAE